MKKEIGFIGLGNMGFGMALNILKKFGSLTVYNRSRCKMEKLCAEGADDGDNAANIARLCDIIILSLPAPADVKSVVGEQLIPNGNSGQWIIDTSTIDPQTSYDLHILAAHKNIHYIDCPVSGGKDGADKGTLTFMVGGTADETEPILPYLYAMGKTVHFMNGIGKGSAIKLINNFMSFSASLINAEAINMASHLNIPLDSFFDVILSSSGGNNNLKSKKSKILAHDMNASFTINLALKDLELAADLCRSAGIPNFSGSNAIQWFRLAQKCGYADKDASSLIYLFQDLIC